MVYMIVAGAVIAFLLVVTVVLAIKALFMALVPLALIGGVGYVAFGKKLGIRS